MTNSKRVQAAFEEFYGNLVTSGISPILVFGLKSLMILIQKGDTTIVLELIITACHQSKKVEQDT